MVYRITMKSPYGPRGMKRHYTAARKATLVAVGKYWRAEKLDEHFKPQAVYRYGFEKRTPAYLRRKRREGRGTAPLVYTGRMRDAMRSKQPSTRVTRGGIVMTWRGLPRHTYITDTIEKQRRGKDKGKTILVRRPNKPEEMTAVNQADADAMGKRYARWFAAVLQRRGIRL